MVVGYKTIHKNDYAIITGTITINGTSSGNEEIDYPEGFNGNNCVPVSLGIKLIEKNGFNYYGNYVNSSSSNMNAYTRYVNLLTDKIRLNVTNPNDTAKTFTYKIVLMKVV